MSGFAGALGTAAVGHIATGLGQAYTTASAAPPLPPSPSATTPALAGQPSEYTLRLQASQDWAAARALQQRTPVMRRFWFWLPVGLGSLIGVFLAWRAATAPKGRSARRRRPRGDLRLRPRARR